MNGLLLDDLAVGYRAGRRGERAVLKGLVARARRGDLTALIGPNGAGKSTLLRTVAGLQPPLAGAVALDGADLLALAPAERALRLAVVLTERVDAGLLTARELVSLGRHPHTGATGVLHARDVAVVEGAIESVGAEHLAARRVGELSDGERQRVLVARALAQEPSVLLLDEPSAFLDVSARVGLLGLLRRLAREQGMCVVVSTHDLELALRLADHLWLVDRGGVLHTGTPESLVADGAVAAVFDTTGLAFNAVTGTFALEADRSSTVEVLATEPAAALITRAFAREGWRRVRGEPSDVVVEPAGDATFHLSTSGGTETVTGWSDLTAWARAHHPVDNDVVVVRERSQQQ
ncbi:ABC transporter ATP-binding protein [Pseudonocardia sp. TRM90224]|uniref:ABC transporter ATP-binding protein n=1 Tax=Pseudonocardia sp. TRM90224 TaxID=2812678 RepID=UPI001E4667B3|nr:ABC transporter ATP-binding protein [Pseudonocardia sp. TRM90224]